MSKRHLRRLAGVLLFLILAFAGDRLMARVLDAITMQSQARFSRLYRGGLQKDVLIFGHSRGVNAFYTPALEARVGGRWLNLSHNAMAMEIEEAVLLDYLEHNPPPKAIMIEVTAVCFDLVYLNNLKMYWRRSPRLQALAAEYARAELYGTRVSHLYYYNAEMFLRVLYYLNRTDQTWINRYVITDALLEREAAAAPQDGNAPFPTGLAALRRIVALTRDRGITLRCIIAPYLPVYLQKYRNFPEVKAQIVEAIGPDTKLWDYSDAVVERDAFADRVHLNEYGSGLLLDKLIADGFFDDIMAPRTASAGGLGTGRRLPAAGG